MTRGNHTRHGMRRGTRLALVAVLGASTVLSGCGLGTSGGYSPTGSLTGPLSELESLHGAPIAVGSKAFTEQLVLGKIAVILLQSAGADVKDLTNIPGASSARQAMLDDQVQFEWEYTGTAWISYLGHDDPIPDEKAQFEAVRKADAANGMVWLPAAPMNNTYGFATTRATAKKLGITKLSQLQQIPASQRTFCVDSEFANRNDGLQPMLKKYDVPLGSGVKQNQLRTFDVGAIYAATAKGLCNFGEVYTTDGRIKALNLQVIDDDRKFFPNYNIAPVFTKQTLDAHPQLAQLFAPVSAKLTDEVLMELNAKVDVEGQEPTDVAWQWLQDAGFIAPR